MLAFALKTLMADRGKALVALSGVVFAFVLVNLQGGMFLGLVSKASVMVDHGAADIWVGRRGIKTPDFPCEIPESWLNRIRGLAGVRRAEPYIISATSIALADGTFEYVQVVGSDPQSMLGSAWTFTQGGLEQLRRPNCVSVDELDGHRLGNPQVGDVLEIGGCRAEIAAKTCGILGFLTTPYVFTSLETARDYLRIAPGYCSYFLVEIDDQADARAVRDLIRRRVPHLDVYTADELSWRTRAHWTTRTGIGASFGGSTLLGVFVGLLMVAQSLYALVIDHLADYATLKAMGATDRQVRRVLSTQALTIAATGTLLGALVTLVVRHFLSTPVMPIQMPPWLMLISAVLVVVLCLISVILPGRRVQRVDPVTVLQE